MAKTWVLTANSSAARLFATSNAGKELQLVQEFRHQESRDKGVDLVADRAGHQKSKGIGHGALVQASEPKKLEAMRFAKFLADVLNDGRTTNQFTELILITPAQFHGFLKKQANSHLHNMICHVIEKDYTNLSEKQLIEHLGKLPKKGIKDTGFGVNIE